ncbi:3-oxoacyl-reductase [Aspergillus uvarum CBS 121591]|uniref:3-oxoacyl-reductase n=1 Tax=Aspergillus uvarum CBS 121591 TaxID=1448315 RepID=A0A319CKT9_9EURO|nr:3-oxoacyl-reductase [Aspergillus uvarum CBS 121591]PYH83737.1 3-oxoacyl-reductase [Aspergillus uvarum CBS 121591]
MAATSSVTKLFDVAEIVAVVTGGGSGLGLYMTRALATNGAKKVYILGRRRHILDQAVAEIVRPDSISPIQCDVTDPETLKSAVALIEKDIGYINSFVPSGSSIPQVQEALLQISMQEFTNTFHVNCTAVFYTAIAFLGLLDAGNKTRNNYSRKGCRSQVIATSSIGSFNRRITAGFAYGASKAATTMLLKVLATYLVPYRIRANVLCPGLFPTDLTTDLIHGQSPTEEGAFSLDQIPAERAGTPEDIMGPLLYLASRAGAYCNGNCMLTDGGRLSVMPATY